MPFPKLMRQTRAWVFEGDTHAEGKIVSVFEPAAPWPNRRHFKPSPVPSYHTPRRPTGGMLFWRDPPPMTVPSATGRMPIRSDTAAVEEA
jgi:hypothetical protein